MKDLDIFSFVKRNRIPYFVGVGNSLDDHKDYFLCVCTADILLIPEHPFAPYKKPKLSQYDLTDSERHWFNTHKGKFKQAHICADGVVYEPTDGISFKQYYKKISDI